MFVCFQFHAWAFNNIFEIPTFGLNSYTSDITVSKTVIKIEV